MNTENRAADRGADRKGFLFCPNCERSAPIDDGWPLSRRDGRTEIACPDCETILVSQPYFDSDCRSPPLTA